MIDYDILIHTGMLLHDGCFSDDTAIDLRVSSSSSAEETPPILPPSLLAKVHNQLQKVTHCN